MEKDYPITVLQGIVTDAFAAVGIEEKWSKVEVSKQVDLAQYQCNGALGIAKSLKKNPREIAQAVVDAIGDRDLIKDLSVAGPGFINFTLRDQAFADWANTAIGSERLNCPCVPEVSKVIIDFGGPNVAKAMHVGHVRSLIIGDCLQRLLRFLGDDVVSDIHLGDWGLQMGMLISEIERRQPDLPYFDADFSGPYPEESPVGIDDLEEIYPTAAEKCKSDESMMEAARTATAELQRGRPGYRALWQHFFDVSVSGLKDQLARLGIHFDLWKGESSVNDRIPQLVARLSNAGIAIESEGAMVIDVTDDSDKKETPPLMLVKSDGAATYGTTDLATIEERIEEQRPDTMLYVVDKRQGLHFTQVFRAAKRAGVSANANLEHIGFGTINGKDGKPYKTREGGVMKLADLIDSAHDLAVTRLDESGLATDFSPEERGSVAQDVGIASVKFADLMNHRMTDYIFELDRFTRFEGKTGPYLQYASVRIRSILRKAEDEGLKPGTIAPPFEEAEQKLLLALSNLPQELFRAYELRAPNVLCEFIYDLAQTFSRFYESCHVMSEENGAIRGSRLALCQLTLREFEIVMGILGINLPERM